MLIQHSLHLLEQLTELEEKIRRIEDSLMKMGIAVESEKVLKAVIQSRKKQFPPTLKN